MITFANDNAHCNGVDCAKRDRCMRYVALAQKREKGGNDRVLMIEPNPKTCVMFLDLGEVRS